MITVTEYLANGAVNKHTTTLDQYKNDLKDMGLTLIELSDDERQHNVTHEIIGDPTEWPIARVFIEED